MTQTQAEELLLDQFKQLQQDDNLPRQPYLRCELFSVKHDFDSGENY